MDVLARLRGGLVLAACALVALTGWRAWSLASSRPADDVQAVVLPVAHLAGGVLVRWEDDGVGLSPRFGRALHLAPGGSATVDGLRFTLRPSARDEVTVLRRPWSVFAHSSAGFRRIDFGDDPLGRTDGVKDRVVVPGEGGAFHLVPDRPERDARFQPDDRGAVLVAERPLRVVQDGSAVRLVAGQRAAVRGDFVVDLEALSLRVRWRDQPRSEAILGERGAVLGYRDTSTPELVVSHLAPGSGHPVLAVLDEEGRELAALTREQGGALLHGAGDRLGPLRRGVLPERAADLQLEQAVAEGLQEGWIRIGQEGTAVVVPAAPSGREPRGDLGWTVSRSLVRLLDGYDRARLPTALQVIDGARPARARCREEAGGDWVGMGWDAGLSAWVPADRGGRGTSTICELPVTGDLATLEVALPGAWSTSDGPWHPWAAREGEWSRHDVPGPGIVRVRLDGRRSGPDDDGVRVVLAGGPRGTALGVSRLSSRAYAGWDGLAGAEAAASVGDALPGDRWTASGVAPGPLPARERDLFLRVPIEAAGGGLVALDVTVPGALRSALWNGEPLELSRFDRARQGASRLSLRLQPGANVLAVHAARPASSPRFAAGGTSFVQDEAGRPSGLAERVVDRRSRAPVRSGEPSRVLADRAGRDAAALRVERGAGDVQTGARIRIAPGRNQPGTVSLPVDGGSLVVRSDAQGIVEVVAPSGTLWSPAGTPVDLPLHPPGSAPLWTEWPVGYRLTVAGSPLRLRNPGPEPAFRTTVPPLGAQAREVSALSLDDDLQDDALRALDAHLATLGASGTPDTHELRGAVLALDAVTGEILACVGRDRRGDPAPSACWEDLDLRPGSSFKPMVALSALGSSDPAVRAMLDGSLPAGLRRAARSGSLDEARLPALPPGSRPDLSLRTRLRNFHGAATPTDRALEGALRSSDNVWFGYLGLLMHAPLRQGWLESGIAADAPREEAWPVRATARAAGWGQPLDLGAGLRGFAGRVPSGAPESDANVAAASVGQDEVRASPLGIALVLAAVATDGRSPRPTLRTGEVPDRHTVADRPAAARVRGALHEVVRVGTASHAFADNPYRDHILGKTGSSQRIDGRGIPRTDSWFAGAVLPPDGVAGSPVVLVAVLPGAGLGGAHAAVVVEAVSRAVVASRGWAPGAEGPRW
jgi:hypothetical protein